jgi:hypothetical protein
MSSTFLSNPLNGMDNMTFEQLPPGSFFTLLDHPVYIYFKPAATGWYAGRQNNFEPATKVIHLLKEKTQYLRKNK